MVKTVRQHREDTFLVPRFWRRYKAKRGLVWKRLQFNPATLSSVPKTRGLYAFTVQPPAIDFPPSSVLFYIGEVGATNGKTRTFNQRYKEYLSELTLITRPKMAAFLNLYAGYVDFYYCELDPLAVDIKKIESELISSLWPAANIADYEASIRKVRAAFK